jgi:ATP/maltotriose-dependent transcriptional regulator MalT
MFHRELIEQTINRRLNETDWKVLHILLEDATYSNREIAEKVSMSIDGIGSSLKRMYLYFDVKETKYRKIALLHTVMNISSVVNSN